VILCRLWPIEFVRRANGGRRQIEATLYAARLSRRLGRTNEFVRQATLSFFPFPRPAEAIRKRLSVPLRSARLTRLNLGGRDFAIQSLARKPVSAQSPRGIVEYEDERAFEVAGFRPGESEVQTFQSAFASHCCRRHRDRVMAVPSGPPQLELAGLARSSHRGGYFDVEIVRSHCRWP